MDTDNNESRRKKARKARERQTARLRKRNFTEGNRPDRKGAHIGPYLSLPVIGNQKWLATIWQAIRHYGGIALSDLWWYLRRNPIIIRGAAFVLFIVVALYFLSYLFSGNILPRVYSMNIDLGGMSVNEAEGVLLDTWYTGIEIELIADGEVVGTTTPDELGMRFDVQATSRNAKGAGLKAIPFGREIIPVVKQIILMYKTFCLIWP